MYIQLCGYCGSALKINDLGRCQYCAGPIAIVIEEKLVIDKRRIVTVNSTDFNELMDTFIALNHSTMVFEGLAQTGKTILMVGIMNKLAEQGKKILYVDKYARMIKTLHSDILVLTDDIYSENIDKILTGTKLDLIVIDNYYYFMSYPISLPKKCTDERILQDKLTKHASVIFICTRNRFNIYDYKFHLKIKHIEDENDRYISGNKRLIKVKRWPTMKLYEFEIELPIMEIFCKN